jgi:hypothetical protein
VNWHLPPKADKLIVLQDSAGDQNGSSQKEQYRVGAGGMEMLRVEAAAKCHRREFRICVTF